MAADPGWYPDPRGAGRRWWDGAAWTEYTDDVDGQAFTPLAPQAPVTPVAPVAPPAYATPGVDPYAPVVPATPAFDPYAAAQVAPAYGQPAASGAWAPVAAPPVGVWRGPIDDRPWVANIADAVRVVFAKYARFDGRAGRPEFWYWALFLVICYAAGFVCALIPFVGFVVLLALVLGGLAVIVPNYAVLVRRLRDAGFHWAWVFLVFAPFGGIALLVMCAQPSKFP